jgi:WD40 repeat protein
VARGRVKSITKVRPEVPRWLAAIVARCLAGPADRRFPDGAELARALVAGPRGAPASGGGPPAAFLVSVGVGLGLLAGFPLGVGWARRRAPPPAPPPSVATVAATEAPPPPVTEAPPATATPAPPPVTEAAPATESGATTEGGSRSTGVWVHAGKATRSGPVLGNGSIDRDLQRLERFTLVTRWGSTRFRHTASVTQVVSAPDADTTISADDHGIVRFWAPTGVSARAPFRTQTGAVKLLAASHDGRRLAWTGEEGGVLVRDLRSDKTQNLVLDEQTPPTVNALTWSGDGRLLAIGSSDNKLRVWDFAARTIAYTVTHATPVTAVALTPDGTRGITATAGGSLHTFTLQPGKVEMDQQLAGPGAPVDRVALTPDGRRAVALCKGKGLLVWDLERKDANLCGDLLTDAPRALSFSADGSKVAAVDASEVTAWDFDKRAIIKRLKIEQKIRAAAIKPGTTLVVATAERTSTFGTIEAETGKLVNSGVGHTGPVTAIAERGARVWTGGLDGSLRRWDDTDVETTLIDRPGWCTAVDVSPDGKLVASAWRGPGDQGVLFVSPAVEPGTHLFVVEGKQGAWAARFSADGATVLCATDGGEVERYAVSGQLQGRPWKAHQGVVLGLLLLPDGRLLTRGAERSGEGSLALWAPAVLASRDEAEPLARCPAQIGWGRAMALVPGHGATALIGCEDGALRWVDVEDQRELRAVPAAHDGPIMAVGVSPDGKLAVTGGMDRMIRVWDAVEGKVLEELPLASSADILFTVVFTREGALLLGFGTGVVVRLEPRAP